MVGTGEPLPGMAPLRLRLAGNKIDSAGVNIHHLGISLLSSQELVNIAASDLIKREIEFEGERGEIARSMPTRRLFLQGHLVEVRRGSLELLIPIIVLPELLTFITSDDVRNFATSVMANLFSSACYILSRGSNTNEPNRVRHGEEVRDLAVQIVPQLERLARCVTPRSAIGNMDLSFEQNTDGESRLHLHIDRGSRDHILDFAETALPLPMCLTGEIRSIDLDHRRATISEAITGNRIELDYISDLKLLKKALGKVVEVQGNRRPYIDRYGGVKNRFEVDLIKFVEKDK